MNIAITGGTGLVGQKLTNYLVEQGHTVTILTRNAANKQSKEHISYVEWLQPDATPAEHLEGTDAFINLAGESIMGRWTALKKERILSSRLEATTELISIIKQLKKKPTVFVNGSAMGYYGYSDTQQFTEEDKPANTPFLGEVTQKWENAASLASELGIRTVYVRIGIVLDTKGGALPKMLLPYKFFVGGKVGSGKQWMSWIHINDLIRLFLFAIEEEAISGPLNATAPHPVRMNQLNRTIANVMSRPHWMPAPSFAIKTALGEMSTLILDGAYIFPRKAIQHGFTFDYNEPVAALKQLLN
ncbi:MULTISPECIES: TIGR01777 family oxidoreductase [Shouchella]|uniref:TIGR01777 family oxidoreductase n=2 Tax=Shouchella TaxID=2893057 RepID=A0ABY7W525_9BACI|nr:MULTISPECIES: TIGR01777 family oxidoreductase [Shouchella]MED4130358.1 TIGR01777 family oxidoreductase [Shouchella miscanthi]WDF02714.1 TIGR01777 family oxidoreductase [Shouchella hunanensis]